MFGWIFTLILLSVILYINTMFTIKRIVNKEDIVFNMIYGCVLLAIVMFMLVLPIYGK